MTFLTICLKILALMAIGAVTFILFITVIPDRWWYWIVNKVEGRRKL